MSHRKTGKRFERYFVDFFLSVFSSDLDNNLLQGKNGPLAARKCSFRKLHRFNGSIEFVAKNETLYMTAVNTERYRKLDAVKKCIVAHQEFWKCHNHAKQSKIQLSNIVTHHEIRLQEYEVELRDIAKSAALLRRFVETTGYNQRIKCIAAEKFEKFLKDSLKQKTEMEFQLRRIQKIQKKNRLTMAHVQVTAASVNRMIESIQEEHILRQHLSHIQRRFVIPTLYDVHNVSVQNKQLTYELNKAKRQLQIAKANYLHHHTSWRHKLRQSRPESPDCS
ncbi:hypothetical protein D915_004543 [Fasciola hepatica]|uniref:DUF4201 domain-containing protein n=1 Tax=Fasciola hepatica TaxID=6192 RepID=A0A4E0RTK7_FASHE|nr:hypothetical protein D915_004543 [Fasciola hepatica]